MLQGSKEWHDFRRQGIGASEASVCLDVNPWRNKHDLWLEKVGVKMSPPLNEAMQRGLDLEAPAREWAERELGLTFKPVVRKSRTVDFMYASLDGITDDNVAIEIKNPMRGLHDSIPEHYMPQVQHQLYVIEAKMMFYMSFDGCTGKIIEVKRDEAYIEKILEAEANFWHNVVNFIEPERPIEYLHRSDKEYQEKLMVYLNNKKHREFWEELENKSKQELISLTETNTMSLGYKITERVRAGNIDYKKMITDCKLLNEVSKYRKEPIKFWQVQESKD